MPPITLVLPNELVMQLQEYEKSQVTALSGGKQIALISSNPLIKFNSI